MSNIKDISICLIIISFVLFVVMFGIFLSYFNMEKNIIKDNNTYEKTSMNVSLSEAITSSTQNCDGNSASNCFDGMISLVDYQNNTCNITGGFLLSGVKSYATNFMKTHYPIGSINEVYTKSVINVDEYGNQITALNCIQKLPDPYTQRAVWIGCLVGACILGFCLCYELITRYRLNTF